MNRVMDAVIKKQYGLTSDEYAEFIKMDNKAYYRLRITQVLNKLAEAHGCECDCDVVEGVTADEVAKEIARQQRLRGITEVEK